MRGYDKIPEHEGILLDLPFYEGRADLTRDQAKPHHQDINMNDPGGGSFLWDRIALGRSAFDNAFNVDGASFDSGKTSFGLGFSLDYPSPGGIGLLKFTAVGGGAADGVYLDCAAANCADLDFTTGDFSIACWINWDSTGAWSEIIIGRYAVDISGWEVYLDISGGRNTVSQRHSHASVAGNTNSNCFSVGWAPGVWAFLGISRIGGDLYPVHYRNGVALTMSYETTPTPGMLDPDTCNQDLTIGCRFTKDANWYRGQMWRPRVWDRALSAVEWLNIFERERGYFGV